MNGISSPTRILLTLSAIKGVGPVALKKVASVPVFWECSLEEWAAMAPQIAKAIAIDADVVWAAAERFAEEQIAAAKKHQARIISGADDDYPRLLLCTKDDPFLLFVKGGLAPEPEQSVAIIGTREPTQHGVTIAKRITQFFVEQKWSVVSGLALGCDSIAHQAALDAKGHTVAVMAHGLQMVAPSRHRRLAQDILDSGGALVSEYPFGRDAIGSQFVKRDRTQAGMAQGVVMVQSDLKGGSLHASRAALDYQRWLAVPYPTERDRENAEPKVQANLLIADGTDAERSALLRCPVSSISLVKVVRGRDDYFKLIGREAPSTASDVDVDSETSDVTQLDASMRAPHVSPEMTLAAQQDHRAKESAVTTSSSPSSDAAQPELLVESKLLSTQVATSHETASVRADSVEWVPSAPSDVRSYLFLQVGPADLADLKIPGVPTGTELGQGAVQGEFDVDLSIALSRLRHLQAKLNDLKKARAKVLVDEERAMLFRFQVEDVVTHMKRVAHQLVLLDGGPKHSFLMSLLVKHGAANGPELPMMGATGRPADVPLVEALDQLVEAMPRSVRTMSTRSAAELTSSEPGIEIHFGDLLLSFKDMVRTVFRQGSYASATILTDRQTKD